MAGFIKEIQGRCGVREIAADAGAKRAPPPDRSSKSQSLERPLAEG